MELSDTLGGSFRSRQLHCARAGTAHRFAVSTSTSLIPNRYQFPKPRPTSKHHIHIEAQFSVVGTPVGMPGEYPLWPQCDPVIDAVALIGQSPTYPNSATQQVTAQHPYSLEDQRNLRSLHSPSRNCQTTYCGSGRLNIWMRSCRRLHTLVTVLAEILQSPARSTNLDRGTLSEREAP